MIFRYTLFQNLEFKQSKILNFILKFSSGLWFVLIFLYQFHIVHDLSHKPNKLTIVNIF